MTLKSDAKSEKKKTDSLMRTMFLGCLSVSYDYEISCISKLLRYNENEVLEVLSLIFFMITAPFCFDNT